MWATYVPITNSIECNTSGWLELITNAWVE